MIKNVLLLTFMLFANFINAQTNPDDSGSAENTVVAESQAGAFEIDLLNFSVFSAPEKDLIVIQKKNLNTENTIIELLDRSGNSIQNTILYQGSTIAFFDTKTLYDGEYTLKIIEGEVPIIQKITLIK